MSTDHTQQDIGTSPTMTDGKPMPEDVWQAILRLEAKRMRQGILEKPGVSVDLIDDDDDYDDEPSDQDMMAAFGTKWHDGL